MTPDDSPALSHRSPLYPVAFRDRVPHSIVALRTVHTDVPGVRVVARKGEVYDCTVNSHGAVAALVPLPGGGHEPLGLMPAEYYVVAWHLRPDLEHPPRKPGEESGKFDAIPHRPAPTDTQ